MADLTARPDIEQIAERILRDSRCEGIFPTPVDRVVEHTKLQLDQGVDLSAISPGLLQRFDEVIRNRITSALSGILGLIDLREKTIYLDLSQAAPRQHFVKLHEVGHHALPWQNDILYLDDERTLKANVTEEFEKEASFFASEILFQGNRFASEAAKLPLGIRSPLTLAGKFGSSKHAALRRYVEYSTKRCALLVLERTPDGDTTRLKVRDVFQSPIFTKEFGDIVWPQEVGVQFSFVMDFIGGRRLIENGSVSLSLNGKESEEFAYHFFRTPYNAFVLLFPIGEVNRSRVRIVVR